MTEQPMSADRRVLAIGAAAMVGLVAVGVVSAQVFTASPCDALEPEPVDARPASADLGEPLTTGLPDLDEDERGALRSALDTLTAHLGPVVAVADVRGAERLVAVDTGVAAIGPVTTVLDASLTRVRATADVGDGVVAGDGPSLWSLAVVNDVTGRVDALLPLDADLVPGNCLDTATVGTPFAFLLDASMGQVLLLRLGEEADAPQVELRGPDGAAWTVDVDLPTAPPGAVAERVSGRLGAELVVVARRATVEDDAPMLGAIDRATGTQRWEVGPDELAGAAPPGEEPVWVRVVSGGPDVVVVALSREDVRERSTFVGLDADDGTPLWAADLDGPREALATDRVGQQLILVVREEVLTTYAVDLADGTARPRVGSAGEEVAVAALGDGRVVLAIDDALTVVTDDQADTVATDVGFADVLALDSGRVVVLLRSGTGAVAVAFGG